MYKGGPDSELRGRASKSRIALHQRIRRNRRVFFEGVQINLAGVGGSPRGDRYETEWWAWATL